MSNTKHFLNGIWNLEFTLPDESKKINTKIEIPSNIEPKLAELGLVEDYMPADNEFATQKFEIVDDWTYSTLFDAPEDKDGFTNQLVFEGIDTIAQIYLNGEEICDCNNMHLVYKIDVTGKLKKTGNELKVIIRSSDLWAREHMHDMYSTSHAQTTYYDSQKYLRKARHQWGWDNAPRLITSGIYRSVYLEEVPVKRFDDVYLYTMDINENSVWIGANWFYKTDKKFIGNHNVRLTVSDNNNIVFEETRPVRFVQGAFKAPIPREKIELWWPSGFGEPKLYDVKLEMLDGAEVVAVYEQSFGFRKLRLERTDDILADGTGEFVFQINGEKVYIRGTNWKPLDALASKADEKTKTLKALNEIVNLNCNMVRIWGGGIYEDKVFYDFCDQNGIMVWQDFMLACEIVPNDEWYCKMVEEEAKQIITKYRNHTSLALWCGDNENDECMMWQNINSEVNPSAAVISRKILKDAVVSFDPYRTYVDSSPYASDANFANRRSGEATHFQPESHLYPDVLYYKEALRDLKSYFIGETGPITVNPIIANKEIFEREKARMERLWDLSPIHGNASHQNDGYFLDWRNKGKQLCLKNFGRDFAFSDWKDYTIAINTSCAEVYKDVIEYCRVQRWTKTGVIWWSLCDMWPMAFNYSILDCELNKKMPYFWIRQAQQEFALMAVRTEINGELALYAANDTRDVHTVEYTVTAYDEQCNKKQIASGICKQKGNSVSMIQRIAESEEPELWIIKWNENGKEYINHVLTGNSSYEVTKKWVEIIGKESGFYDEILELKEWL